MHKNAPYKEYNWAEGLIEMHTLSNDFIVVKLALQKYKKILLLLIIIFKKSSIVVMLL